MAGLRELVSFNRLGDFWGILREVDPGAVERDARRTVRLVICGPAGVGKRRLAAQLTAGEYVGSLVDVYDMPDDVASALPDADAYLYVTSPVIRSSIRGRDNLRQVLNRGAPVLVALTDSAGPDLFELKQYLETVTGLDSRRIVTLAGDSPDQIIEELVPALLAAAPLIALPLGRQLPALRAASADRLVRETSRVNAEFAALSSLPSFIPIVGGLATVGADMIVLTKNQVMLVLKLGIVNGRPMDNRLQVMAEVLPIVGAGLLWRSIARTLVSLIPGPLAIAPKVAIAYVGTFVVGKAAQYYYRVGQRPSPELLEHFQREALDQFQALLPVLSQLGRRSQHP